MKEYINLLKLSTRIYSNTIINDSNTLIYCFSHNIETINPMIDMLKKHNIKKIHIIKNLVAVSGVDNYKIIEEKYNKNNITCVLIPFNHEIIHTKNESNTVIKYAMDNLYKNIIVVAPIFHVLRATMTIISSAIEQYANIRITSIINETLKWNTYYSTHQGNTNTSLTNIMDLEIERILKYTEKGDIKSCSDIWEYLDNVNINNKYMTYYYINYQY